jgi:hypothetical protein
MVLVALAIFFGALALVMKWTETEMTDWQPIETAPKDGTNILLWCPLPGSGYAIVGICHTTTRANGDKVPVWLDAYEGEDIYQPSHWMPLPEPPITSA